jgi:hypothetical protein
MKLSETALSFQNVPSTTQTRIWRARAETLSTIGDSVGATEAVAEALRIAKSAGLAGQMRKATALRRRMIARQIQRPDLRSLRTQPTD